MPTKRPGAVPSPITTLPWKFITSAVAREAKAQSIATVLGKAVNRCRVPQIDGARPRRSGGLQYLLGHPKGEVRRLCGIPLNLRTRKSGCQPGNQNSQTT